MQILTLEINVVHQSAERQPHYLAKYSNASTASHYRHIDELSLGFFWSMFYSDEGKSASVSVWCCGGVCLAAQLLNLAAAPLFCFDSM